LTLTVNPTRLFEIMGRITKSNLPQDIPLRWNVEKGAAEFGLSIMTLRKSLAKTSATPDQDGLFTTRQIAGAVYGDALSEEKLRTQRQLTRKLELENAITEGNVLNRQALSKTFALIADAISTRIMSATEIPRSVREDLLREISTWPLALEEARHAQTRLPRGNHPDEDGSES
jgi:hypothetical protein